MLRHEDAAAAGVLCRFVPANSSLAQQQLLERTSAADDSSDSSFLHAPSYDPQAQKALVNVVRHKQQNDTVSQFLWRNMMSMLPSRSRRGTHKRLTIGTAAYVCKPFTIVNTFYPESTQMTNGDPTPILLLQVA